MITHRSADALIDLMTLYRTEAGMSEPECAFHSLERDLMSRRPSEVIKLAASAIHQLATINWPEKRYVRKENVSCDTPGAQSSLLS